MYNNMDNKVWSMWITRSEPTTNGVLNGHVHHHNSLNSQHQPQQQQQQLQNHINSGAGLQPAFTSNKMDSYRKTPFSSNSGWSQYGGRKDSGKQIAPVSITTTNTSPSTMTSPTQPISMKDFINYEADAVFSQSPPTIPKYKQSISLPMSPTSSERSFSIQRQPLSPGSHQNPAMSGSYERATRPLGTTLSMHDSSC
ncbi:hypothetical protein LOTGIDRAFT_154107 [Lottia gigantea]|uniref:Uncharacterized protein n=1 Tax=Lottia gigantea TaxID=225164 RepID=V3ZXC9_LOTGI|nr:hypothetical protein LOTGIDRAFT_154107 [Lottia gigantea]ESO89032.1 hypothetical protein LOTGIDRAFT_154107 [Lottia gigantea]